MNFSLLTYNVLYNKAYLELEKILKECSPDIVCLQEIDTEEKNLEYLEKFGFKLADYSNSFLKFGKIYGIATFYNPNRLRLIESNFFFLPKSIYEFFLTVLKMLKGGNKSRTLLETHFMLNKSKTRIAVFNTHLTLLGANGIRLKQIKEALVNYEIKEKKPLIMAGDFNYFPYGRKNLENLMKQYGFAEATRNIDYTIKYSPSGKREQYNFIQKLAAKLYSKFFTNRLKIDYIYYKNLVLKKTERIDLRLSDHFPIISYFETNER